MLRLAFSIALALQLAAGCGSDAIPGTGGTGGTGGTTVEPGAACLAFCATFIGTCAAFTDQTEAECRLACQGTIEDGRAASENCADAYEAGFQCVSELECADVYPWRDRLANPCQSFNDNIAAICP